MKVLSYWIFCDTNDVSMSMKMFVFGTKALEQFVDRLIEWPQYCNHILQISHLRATNSELVTFIERALARISAAHSESDAFHSTSGDQHGPNQATSMEVNRMCLVSCLWVFQL